MMIYIVFVITVYNVASCDILVKAHWSRTSFIINEMLQIFSGKFHPTREIDTVNIIP